MVIWERTHRKSLQGASRYIKSSDVETNIKTGAVLVLVLIRSNRLSPISSTDPLTYPPHRTWTCDIASCTSSANFTRIADLQRHQSTVHGVGTPGYPCNVPRCKRVGAKGFTRRDHLFEHLRSFHHIDIPKRRPGERTVFPFGWPDEFTGGSHQ